MKINGIIEIRNSKNQLIKKQKMNSWVRQFLERLYCQMLNTTMAITRTSGTSTSANANNSLIVSAGVGDTNYGIVLGTSNDAVSINDYNLKAPIAHGSGSGQLQYSAVSASGLSYTSNSTKFNLSRTVTNNSGSTITIKEIGLIENRGSTYYTLIERSLIEFEIPNGESFTVTYTFEITV